jgi:FHA domain
MDELIIVSELHSRKIINKINIYDDKILIGRGFDNDIIIDDSYVSKNHLGIKKDENDDTLIITDLNSKNGFFKFEGKKKIKIDQSLLTSGSRFKIGKTKISFFSSDHNLEDTKILQEHKLFINRFKLSFWAILSLLVAVFCESFLGEYLESFREKEFMKYLASSFAFYSLMVIGWSGIWAFVNWLIKKEFNFFKHFLIFSIFIILIDNFERGANVLFFNFPFVFWLKVITLPNIILSILMIYLTIKNSTKASKVRSLIISVIISFTVIFFIWMNDFSATKGYNSSIVFIENVESPFFNFREGKNMSDLKEKHLKLFDKIKLEKEDE